MYLVCLFVILFSSQVLSRPGVVSLNTKKLPGYDPLYNTAPINDAYPVQMDYPGGLSSLNGYPGGVGVSKLLYMYPNGYQNGYPNGISAGYPNGMSPGYPNGMSPGYPNGISAGFPNGISAGYPNGISAGYPNGISAGYPNGISAGFPNGISAGFPTGFPNAFPSGYQAGYPSGLNTGRLTGYSAGYPSGLSAGYPSGTSNTYSTGLTTGITRALPVVGFPGTYPYGYSSAGVARIGIIPTIIGNRGLPSIIVPNIGYDYTDNTYDSVIDF